MSRPPPTAASTTAPTAGSREPSTAAEAGRDGSSGDTGSSGGLFGALAGFFAGRGDDAPAAGDPGPASAVRADDASSAANVSILALGTTPAPPPDEPAAPLPVAGEGGESATPRPISAAALPAPGAAATGPPAPANGGSPAMATDDEVAPVPDATSGPRVALAVAPAAAPVAAAAVPSAPGTGADRTPAGTPLSPDVATLSTGPRQAIVEAPAAPSSAGRTDVAVAAPVARDGGRPEPAPALRDRPAAVSEIAVGSAAAARPTPATTPPAETAATAAPVDEGTDSAAAGGLLGALGRLFTPADEPAPASQPAAAAVTAEAAESRSMMVAEPRQRGVVAAPPENGIARAEAVRESEAASGAPGGGLFGAIGRIFGGDSSEETNETSPAATAALSPAVEAAPAPVSAPLQPAVNLEQGVVVRIPGTTPPAGPAATTRGQVLVGQGDRIRQLLGEAPAAGASEPVPAAVAPVAERAPTATPATVAAAPVPEAVAPAPAANTMTMASAMPAEEVTVTASAAVPAPSVSVAPPLPGLSGGVAPAGAPTLPPLQTAQSIEASRAVARAVVMVVTPSGSGSGALVDRSGHVVTNWHLVDGHGHVTVLIKDAATDDAAQARAVRARVVRYSRFADLALLRLDETPAGIAPIALGSGGAVREGGMLHAIGHPDGGTWTHTPVIVTRVKPDGSWYSGRSFLHKADLVRGQAHADPGASGAGAIAAGG